MAWLNFRETVKNIYFGVIVLAGVLFCIATSTTAGSMFGTMTWPVTYQMLELVSGTFAIFVLVIITFYAGELAWRERETRLDQIHDALPMPTWLPFLAKLLALMLVPVLLQAVLMLCGLGIQTAKGYAHFELGLYVEWLFGLQLVDYWLVCVLALVVHSLVNQKYVGHFVMIVYFVALSFSDSWASSTTSTVRRERQLHVLGHERLRALPDARRRLRRLLGGRRGAAGRRRLRCSGSAARPATGARGCAIARTRFTPPVERSRRRRGRDGRIRRLHLLQHQHPEHVRDDARPGGSARPTTRSSTSRSPIEPQPKITDVTVTVDLYPSEQRVRMRGRYALQNRSGQPIDRFTCCSCSRRLRINTLQFTAPAQIVTDDRATGLRSYRLATPLAPEATLALDFDLEIPTHGFTNAMSTTDVVYNGTFVNGQAVLPVVGYDERVRARTDRDRKNTAWRRRSGCGRRDDPVGFAAQRACGRRRLHRLRGDRQHRARPDRDRAGLPAARVDGGRPPLLPLQDGRADPEFLRVPVGALRRAQRPLARRRDRDLLPPRPRVQRRPDDRRDEGVARLLHATFGPYQHQQVRILEFPRYETFAQSFPNTIPYLRRHRLHRRVRDDDPDDIDYPYYVTAHEVAHQWWAHQVIGANVQGATMLVETLAQYSALMVMKKEYGDAKMRRFLRYELDRYLLGRGGEQKKELPLSRVENQPYIHYRKGSLVMYALRDYIGEDKLNRALRAYRDEWAFKGPPYPSTTRADRGASAR